MFPLFHSSLCWILQEMRVCESSYGETSTLATFLFLFFCKKSERGVWQLWNLVCWGVKYCREKKVHNSIFVRAAVHGANIFIIYMASFLPATFNCGPQHINHILSLFWLNCYWLMFKFAGFWACNQLAPKYVKESKSAFQIFVSETNKPFKVKKG